MLYVFNISIQDVKKRIHVLNKFETSMLRHSGTENLFRRKMFVSLTENKHLYQTCDIAYLWPVC